MSTDQNRTSIVKALSLGEFVSGQELADNLGLSRSSIANYIKELSNMGLDIFKVTGRGYKLAKPLIMIDKATIAEYLKSSSLSADRVEVLNVVGSTNDEIKRDFTRKEKGSVCIAEAQTKGRGRRGRQWVSPYGASVYMSMLWRFESGYESIAGLSLAVGLAVKRALVKTGCDAVQLKWPNDIYVFHKKLAGILVEIEGQLDGVTETVIGIGINVNLPTGDLGIEQEYIDFSTVMDGDIDRNLLCANLINELWTLLDHFESTGIQPYVEEWREADVFKNKQVVLIAGKQTIEGICRGINETGALLLETPNGIKSFHGGEVSVRPNTSS